MKANIKLSLFELTVVKLLALLRNVYAKMTGNPNFDTPAVKLTDMEALANELEAAIEAATNGSRQSKLVRNALVTQAREMLRVQADYVRSVCAGDVVKLESSGYELAKQREPIGITRRGRPVAFVLSPEDMKDLLAVRDQRARALDDFQVFFATADARLKPEARELDEEEVKRLVNGLR